MLFAADTNLTFIDVESEVVQKELNEVKNWRSPNKLSLNVDKTVQMNVKQNAIDNVFLIDNSTLNVQHVCMYLGVFVDNKLSLVSHAQYVTSRLSQHCGILAKLRHLAPQSKIIEYYKTNDNSIIQYGVLIYCCTSYSMLEPIFMLQKKILKLIYLKKYSDSSSDLFMKPKILNVYQLHIYELLNFVFKSLSKLHQEPQLNDMCTFVERLITRSSAQPLLKETICRKQIEKRPVKERATKLFDALPNADVFPEDIVCGCVNKLIYFYHNFKEIY